MKQRNIQLYRMAKHAIATALYTANKAIIESIKFDSVLARERNSNYFKKFIVTIVQRKRSKVYAIHM
jgi:hypothetical protein